MAPPALGAEGPSDRLNDEAWSFAVTETDGDLVRCPAAPRPGHGRTTADPCRGTRLDVNVRGAVGYRAPDGEDLLIDLAAVGDGVIEAQGDPKSKSEWHQDQRGKDSLPERPRRHSTVEALHRANSIARPITAASAFVEE